MNFLSDPCVDPHLRSDELARLLGVKQRSTADKGRLIMDTLRISQLAPKWSRRDMIDKNPLLWLVEADGLRWTHASCPSQSRLQRGGAA